MYTCKKMCKPLLTLLSTTYMYAYGWIHIYRTYLIHNESHMAFCYNVALGRDKFMK